MVSYQTAIELSQSVGRYDERGDDLFSRVYVPADSQL